MCWNQLTEEDVKTFLLIAYFGDFRDDPIYVAANNAYLDLCRTIKFKTIPSITEEKKAELRRWSVDKIRSSVIELSEIADLDCEKFDNWHKILCNALKKHYNDNGVQFHYGQAQKWVNMTMKYLSVIDRNATAPYFAYLHVPVDSIVIDLASEELGLVRPQSRWSRMASDEYIEYQKALCNAIREHNNLAPMLWEFRCWNR